MKKSSLIITFTVAGLLVLSLFFVGPKKPAQTVADGSNVHMEGNTQVVEIKAGGGYAPARSVAKAGIPTVVRFTNSGSFDCSSSVRIPSLDISKTLSQKGTTDIPLGTPSAGPLQGMCGMGMYPFEVDFKN